MPLDTSASTDSLAHRLAALRGVSADEAVAEALRGELARYAESAAREPGKALPSAEDMLSRIRALGPWDGPSGNHLENELYDSEGLPR